MQKRFLLAPAAVMAFILFFTVFGDRGLLMINRLHRDRDEMQQRLSELKGENEKLKREIAALQSDRRYLESIARHDFGLVRSNETVYQFPAQKPQAAPAGAQGAAAAAASGAPPDPKQQPGEPHGTPKAAAPAAQKGAVSAPKGGGKAASQVEQGAPAARKQP